MRRPHTTPKRAKRNRKPGRQGRFGSVPPTTVYIHYVGASAVECVFDRSNVNGAGALTCDTCIYLARR